MNKELETVIEDTDAIEVEKQTLFSINGITEGDVEEWKKQFGTIGWLTFAIPGVDHAVVFVYRSLGRREWKDVVRPKIQKLGDEDLSREVFCSYMLLHPPIAKEVDFWDTAPAFLPDTIEQVIMEVSGMQPLTVPSRL